MIQHVNNGQEFLLVDVPIGSVYYGINENALIHEFNDRREGVFLIGLPAGEWEIVGKGDELTQGQAKEIVKEPYSTDTHIILNYHDYKQGLRLSASPLRSFETLLESHSLTPANTLVIKKKL